MKVVIIGGGIAGLALANLLLRKGVEVSLHERELGNQARGHAFLMHPAGIAILEELGKSRLGVPVPGQPIHQVVISQPDLSNLHETNIGNWLCLSRPETVQYLHYLLPTEVVKFGHAFSHFSFQNNQVSEVHFMNGESEKGDVFIAADGAKSMIRQSLFGATEFTQVEVKEIVGLVRLPGLIREGPHIFRKYVSPDKGLALGFVPCSSDHLVWFMQFDVRFQMHPEESSPALEHLCRKLLADFPSEVAQILDAADFSNAYVWNSIDFDLLPAFHQKNVFLMGDAAHLALSFTSAGTSNALQDALILSELLLAGLSVEEAGKEFYSIRAPIVAEHILFGRSIKNEFLQPNGLGRKSSIPLIQKIG